MLHTVYLNKWNNDFGALCKMVLHSHSFANQNSGVVPFWVRTWNGMHGLAYKAIYTCGHKLWEHSSDSNSRCSEDCKVAASAVEIASSASCLSIADQNWGHLSVLSWSTLPHKSRSNPVIHIFSCAVCDLCWCAFMEKLLHKHLPATAPFACDPWPHERQTIPAPHDDTPHLRLQSELAANIYCKLFESLLTYAPFSRRPLWQCKKKDEREREREKKCRDWPPKYQFHLVGGFNPFENLSQIGSFPQVGMKIFETTT